MVKIMSPGLASFDHLIDGVLFHADIMELLVADLLSFFLDGDRGDARNRLFAGRVDVGQDYFIGQRERFGRILS